MFMWHIHLSLIKGWCTECKFHICTFVYVEASAGAPVGLAASQRLHKRTDDSVTGSFIGPWVGRAGSQKNPISSIRKALGQKVKNTLCRWGKVPKHLSRADSCLQGWMEGRLRGYEMGHRRCPHIVADVRERHKKHLQTQHHHPVTRIWLPLYFQ